MRTAFASRVTFLDMCAKSVLLSLVAERYLELRRTSWRIEQIATISTDE